VREEPPSLHGLVLLSLPAVGGADDADRRGLVVGEAHVPTGDAQAIGDPREHVVGHDLATLEDLRHLGLGLAGHRGDLALRDTVLAQEPVNGADLARRESRSHLRLLPRVSGNGVALPGFGTATVTGVHRAPSTVRSGVCHTA
jgi:hypothetical protein